MEHEAWFFVGIFAFIFLIWIATGGPVHPLSFTGPSLAQPEELGGGTYLRLPRAPFTLGSNQVILPGSSNGPGYTFSSGTSAPEPVPAPVLGVPFGLPSDYRNVVSLSTSVSNASSTNEYVEIAVSQNSSQAITITGWALQSMASSNAELIPKGTTVPTSGVVNATEDIVLHPGDRAIISTGPSPVGASFRINKCTGYFSAFQTFSPPLPQSCPSASDELLAAYGTPYIHDPACIDYANTLSTCQVPLTQKASLNSTCESFLENRLSYNGCVAGHKSDSNFNGTTWRIYLNRTYTTGKQSGTTKPMWRSSHDVVRLIDERGKTVAQFGY